VQRYENAAMLPDQPSDALSLLNEVSVRGSAE
jgi:hypothetical protein